MACATVVEAPCNGALALRLASADCTNCATLGCRAPALPCAVAGPSPLLRAVLTAASTLPAYFRSKDLVATKCLACRHRLHDK